MRFLSTPSARRATRVLTVKNSFSAISIHALREEGDFVEDLLHVTPDKFLSTPSARRATFKMEDETEEQHISIHALREEGDSVLCAGQVSPAISIHALREEGDKSYYALERAIVYFYPRPPRGGRRSGSLYLTASREISIHALREEGDSKNRDKISIFKQIIQHSARI